jgi:hypothetical protein
MLFVRSDISLVFDAMPARRVEFGIRMHKMEVAMTGGVPDGVRAKTGDQASSIIHEEVS